jgi:hypothetical protein
MSVQKKPVNYLNNRDILKEIHASKNSYCSFAKPEHHQYDIIIDYENNDNLQRSLEYASQSEVIQRAKELRAHRTNQQATDGVKITAHDIDTLDLVFRIMSWDHIPLSPKEPRKTIKKKKAQDIIEFDNEEDSLFEELEEVNRSLAKDMGLDDMVHSRVNFPPFQHFKIDSDGSFYCVGKSHWQGDLFTGEFSKDHGQITDKLARMYLKLCEKYAMRFNWRGYTYNDEMRGAAILQLTYVGLRFNEAKSANPFAYYTAAINNSFCRVLNTEKRNQNIRDDIMEMNGLQPSWSRQHSAEIAKYSE